KNDGYRYNSANTQYKLNYQGRVHLNNGHFLDIIGGTFFNEFGANGFYAAPYDVDAVETVNTSYFALQSSIQKNKWTLRPLAYYRYNSDHYVFIADQPEVYQNWHFGTTAGAELHASQKNKWGNLGLGIESRGEILASNNLGKRSRYYFNTYAEQQVKLGDKTTVVAGVNGQYNASSNTFSFFPGLELNQTLSNTIRAYANLGTGNRMASFTEMYYVGPGNIGNDSLNSEMARYVEVGMRKSGKIQFNASAFYRQVIDAITYTRETGTTVWAPSNFTSVVYRGAQFNAAMKVMDKTNFSLNYMYLDANFSLDEGIETKYAFEHARHRLVGQLSYQWNKSFSTLLAGRYVHRFIGTNYTLFDLRLNWNLRENVSMTADITNLLNRKYIDSGFVEMPGRWYRIGFKFNLNNK
ncbi:MAG: TonB-dependent receptor domain-containing protein, partial [Bacteroidota bacterium]